LSESKKKVIIVLDMVKIYLMQLKKKMSIAALNRTKSNKPGTLVEITNITTNITTQFSSIRKAAEGIHCNYTSLQRYQTNYLSNINIDKTIPLFKRKYKVKFIK
jgi:hypothetical protein